MRRLGFSIDLAGFAALALAAAPAFGPSALAPSALAQSASDFRLPPGESPKPAGPVDPEPPAARPTAAPTPVPSPAATPPRIVLPPPTATPTARPMPSPSPRSTAVPARRPSATPVPAAAAPAPTPTPVVPLPAATPTAAESAAPPAEPPASEPAAQPLPWPAIAAGAGLVFAIGLIVWLLRRGRAARIAAAEERLTGVSAAPPAPVPPPAPAPAEPAAPQPAPPAPPPAAPFAPLPRGDFTLSIEPMRLTLAMINATFVYRLTIGNPGPHPLGPIRISCDMISAHASLATAEQLVPDPAQAWLAHEFEAIPPGESIVIDGELRLPRAEIRPIRSGQSAIFVPLARFTLQTLAGGAPQLLGARVFVIGEEPEQPGAPVRAFRLNEGTRSYSRISQREVAIA